MKPSFLKILSLPIALLSLYVVYWFSVSLWMTHNVENTLNILRQYGLTVDVRISKIKGFPTAFKLSATNIYIDAPLLNSTLKAPLLSLHTSAIPWKLSHIQFSMSEGFQFLQNAGHKKKIHASNVAGDIKEDKHFLPKFFNITADNFFADIRGAESYTLKSDVLTSSFTRHDAPSDILEDIEIGLTLKAQNILLPPQLRRYINQAAQNFNADLRIVKLPPVLLSRAQLKKWRTRQGALQIEEISIEWGTLDITGTGVFNLDQELQPEGSATIHIKNPEQAFNVLSQMNILDQNTISVVSIGSSAFKNPNMPNTVSLPFNIKQRTIGLGPFPIGKLSKIIWP